MSNGNPMITKVQRYKIILNKKEKRTIFTQISILLFIFYKNFYLTENKNVYLFFAGRRNCFNFSSRK